MDDLTPQALDTAGAVIDALGGTTKTARRLDVSPSRVSNWRRQGRFPDSVSLLRDLRAACHELGLEIDETLFRPEAAA